MANAAVDLALSQAYTWLICNEPFFATLLFKLERVEDPTCETMWTDGRLLGYNPDFVLSMSRDERIGVLAHEVLHVASLHPWRRQARQPTSWNVACDHVVNQIVKDAGLTLPSDCLPGVPNKSAEELYVDLPPQQGGGQGQGKGNGPGEVRDAQNPDGSPLSEAQREQQMQEAKINVQQAVNAAKRAGKLPAGLDRYAQDLLEPKVPWKEILSRFLDGQAKNDYSWTRPNRRFMQSGILMPGLHSQAYGTIALGCDTSGSVDEAMLKEICSEVFGVLETYAERGQQPELDIAWFDTKVYPQTVSDTDDMLQPKGGGGTDFSAVMEWAAEKEVKPKAVVMVTDGQCSSFGTDPGVPVLWVLTETNRSFSPPFGELTCTLNEG